MKLSLFKRQLLISVGITLAFVVLASTLSYMLMRLEHDRIRRATPPETLSRLIDGLVVRGHLTPEDALEVVKESSPDGPRFLLRIMTGEELLAAGFKREELPLEVHQSNRQGMGPPPIGGPPEIVRLAVPGGKFLALSIDASSLPPAPAPVFGAPTPAVTIDSLTRAFRPPPPPGGPVIGSRATPLMPGLTRPFMINFGLLAVSIVSASALSLFVFFYSMRSRAAMVSQVISRMKRGDLSARLPINRTDEAGLLMLEFNKMADEIQRLVTNIKLSEQSRMNLLQELAHDLRTPIASLKTLIENLHHGKERIKPEMRDELMGLAVQEIEYFERLVEDLLFLARVNEPKYLLGREEVDIDEILDDEIGAVSARYAAQGRKIEVVADDATVGDARMEGDPHLFRRLLRNALENAFSFARSRVVVRVTNCRGGELTAGNSGDVLKIEIVDDGPGLDAAALAAFGEKRITRTLATDDGRLSVGLGSVIMRTIAQLHGGQLTIENVVPSGESSDGTAENAGAGGRLGARVVVLLPKTAIMADISPAV